MRRKQTTSYMMKSYIAQSLLWLMDSKPYESITIGEITKKAGVNRSTYYRHFHEKGEIIKFYFMNIIDEYLDKISTFESVHLQGYLIGMFTYFKQYEQPLLLLYRAGVSYHILDALNKAFAINQPCECFEDRLQLYYHTGGIFNSFQLWFSEQMKEDPRVMTLAVLHTLPKDFVPMLRRNK